MTARLHKIGVIVSCWDTLRRTPEKLARLEKALKQQSGTGGIMIYSRAPTAAAPDIFRAHFPRSFVAGPDILSPQRLARLCGKIFIFDGKTLTPRRIAKPKPRKDTPRLGLIVSNGYGLGHVMRMQAFAQGLKPFAQTAFLSFSAALAQGKNIFHLPSAEYLELDRAEAHAYTREGTLRFLNQFNPTHVLYDGNVLPEGMLAALALRPHIHLTWIRRGMWRENTAPRFMAQQALADLVIEPGDLAQSCDSGPSWNARLEYCPPGAFLKTPPVRARAKFLSRTKALETLGLDPAKRYALLMPGACRNAENTAALKTMTAAAEKSGLIPVIAHWPMSRDAPPAIRNARTIEIMPLAPYYRGFEIIISAAGYNSFHEILAAGVKTIFIPQEDEGRDMQLIRARYAADHDYAALCRRESLGTLYETISRLKKPAPVKPKWLEDWSAIAAAMGIKPGKKTGPAKKSETTSAALLKKIHRSWRAANKPYKARFVLALDISAQNFIRKKPKQIPGMTTIVVTNSVDPVALRRMGYKYVWLNPGAPWAVRRQFLAWLKIWKPGRIAIL